jgi:hypothetical protein
MNNETYSDFKMKLNAVIPLMKLFWQLVTFCLIQLSKIESKGNFSEGELQP